MTVVAWIRRKRTIRRLKREIEAELKKGVRWEIVP